MSPDSYPFGDDSSSATPPVPMIVGMKRKAPDSDKNVFVNHVTNDLLQSSLQRNASKFKIPKLSSFLPLLRDSIPSVAAEIEAELSLNASRQGTTQDDYGLEEHGSTAHPLVQVDEIYNGPDDSGWESDDSNDENNPKFDYPEFETYEDEIEIDSREQTDEDEEEDGHEDADMCSYE